MNLFLHFQSALQIDFANTYQNKPAFFKIEISFTNSLSKYLMLFLFFLFTAMFCSKQAFGDYTVASGTTINATELSGQSGVLTINGQINISSNVFLPNITSVIINGPTGNIFWTNNCDFLFALGTPFVVYNAGIGVGLQPTVGNGNASQRLIIGTTIIAVSSDNASNAPFSFEDFNGIGGLPQFSIAALTPVCSSSAVSLSINSDKLAPSGKSYKGSWSISPTSGIFSPVVSSISGSAFTSGTTINLAAGVYNVSCQVSMNNESIVNKLKTITVNQSNIWIGASSNWNDASNWCPAVPGASSDIIIPAGISIYPIINAGLFPEAVAKNITIQSNASFTINKGGSINVKGNLNNSGIITNNGFIKLNGTTGKQNFPGSLGTINAMNGLEIANSSGVTINQSFYISSELKPTTGILSLGNFEITLKSTTLATASVSALGAASAFSYGTGRFIVERYIKTGGKWQYLAVPTNEPNQTISQAWQEGAGNATQNPLPGYGMYITGPSFPADGLDAYTPAYSIKTFKNSVPGGWQMSPATSTKFSAFPFNGFMSFVRSSRNAANPLSFPGPTTLRTKGALFSGNQTIDVAMNALTGIGNPYASAIDLRNLYKIGLQNVLYIWDPSLGGYYGVGGYRTLTLTGGNYSVSPSGGIYGSTYNFINSGQAFFVVPLSGAVASVRFEENDKALQNDLVSFAINKTQRLNVNLYQRNKNDKFLLDGMLAIFDESFCNSVDDQDAKKMMNATTNAGWKREEQLLAIERRLPVKDADTLFIYLDVSTQQEYEWELNMEEMQADGREAFLEDIFLHTKTNLNLTGSNYHSFETNAVGSESASRFRIVWSQKVNNIIKEQIPVALVENIKATMSVYPNPVVNKMVNLQFYNIAAGPYTLFINNLQGQRVFSSFVQIAGQYQTKAFQLPATLSSGKYQLAIAGAKGLVTALQVQIQ